MSFICRACLQKVEKSSFFYIDTFDNTQISNTIPKDVLLLCVPEMDLYISEQPGVCSECLNMFETFYQFKNRCLASEEKILNFIKQNKVDSQCKISLGCVVGDSDYVCVADEPENNRALALLEGNGELDLIKIRSISPVLPAAKDESDDLLLSCNDCSFATSDSTMLTAHKCITATDKYKCPYCDYASNRRYRLSYHINAKHTKNTWFACPSCQYKTTDPGCLHRHRKVVHAENCSPVHSCRSCDFKCESEAALQRHRAANHGPALQVCPICNYQTRDRSNFRKHTFIHGDKPRKCTKCKYQCVSPYQLERHYKRSHC